jgi:hypothetical protein
MRDLDVIDSELRLLAAVAAPVRETGGPTANLQRARCHPVSGGFGGKFVRIGD